MTKLYNVASFLILMFFFGKAMACPQGKAECTMDKKEWIAKINNMMPAMFCKADSPFVQCFEVNQPKCYELSKSLTQQCMSDYEKIIPNAITKEDSKKWGEIIGSCAGEKFTKNIKLKEGKSASCIAEHLK